MKPNHEALLIIWLAFIPIFFGTAQSAERVSPKVLRILTIQEIHVIKINKSTRTHRGKLLMIMMMMMMMRATNHDGDNLQTLSLQQNLACS